jgi:hypothetical protein
LLLAGLGGLTQEEIADALDEDTWAVGQAIRPLRRFLLGDERLELMHLELRRAARSSIRPRERRRYEQLLLDWCKSYQAEGWPDHTPDYVMDHTAAHLDMAGDTQSLYKLIDRRWMELKQARTGSHRSFNDALLLLIQAAAADPAPLNLAQLVKANLLRVYLVTNVWPAVLKVLARTGQV